MVIAVCSGQWLARRWSGAYWVGTGGVAAGTIALAFAPSSWLAAGRVPTGSGPAVSPRERSRWRLHLQAGSPRRLCPTRARNFRICISSPSGCADAPGVTKVVFALPGREIFAFASHPRRGVLTPRGSPKSSLPCGAVGRRARARQSGPPVAVAGSFDPRPRRCGAVGRRARARQSGPPVAVAGSFDPRPRRCGAVGTARRAPISFSVASPRLPASRAPRRVGRNGRDGPPRSYLLQRGVTETPSEPGATSGRSQRAGRRAGTLALCHGCRSACHRPNGIQLVKELLADGRAGTLALCHGCRSACHRPNGIQLVKELLADGRAVLGAQPHRYRRHRPAVLLGRYPPDTPDKLAVFAGRAAASISTASARRTAR